MAKLKDIPFGSEIPTYDNDGYIALSKGLKGPTGSAIIETCDGLAFFIGEACCACCASDAYNAWSASYASEACCACCASYACCVSEAYCACYASCATCADYACCACEAYCACCACEACYLSYCDSHLSPSYCDSLSAYLLV